MCENYLSKNGSLVANANVLKEQERLENTAKTYTDEIDFIIKNLTHKDKSILTGIKMNVYSVYDVPKNNINLVQKDTIDIEGFLWKAVLTDINENNYTFTYDKGTLVPETVGNIPLVNTPKI